VQKGDGGMTISRGQTSSIRALGRIESYKNDIRLLQNTIARAPLWQPGISLNKQGDEILRMVAHLEERFGRKLVVTLIGPCGSGKSTMLNALAGVDDLSKVGHMRPTTKNIIVFGQDRSDADQFIKQLGGARVESRSSHMAASLEHVVLIDTPDTDSTEMEKHIPLLREAITLSDVLICVFDSENPKRRDHVDFLAPYVRLFTGDALVVVINKCDRQDKNELEDKIVPEFFGFITSAWERPIQTVLCVSARRHLNAPKWDETASPKHDFDQFEELRQLIFGTFNRPGYIVDKRLEHVRNLRDYVFDEANSEAAKDFERLKEAKANIKVAEKKAVEDALATFKTADSKHTIGINVMLYQRLAHKWLGPVGWMIAIWARILIFGTGIVSILRFGNPIRQIMGMVSSLRHFKEARVAIDDTGREGWFVAALRDYRLAISHEWPDIAESLVKSRFDSSVRRIEEILPEKEVLNMDLGALWSDALDITIEKTAQGLSNFMLQLIFNIPALGILCHVGWVTVRSYVSKNFLSTDFFLHSFLIVAIILLLSFFLFQGCVRLVAGADRIVQKTLARVKQQVDQFRPISMNPLGEQIDAVLTLDVKELPTG
jgi:GTPase SAR1 family protein